MPSYWFGTTAGDVAEGIQGRDGDGRRRAGHVGAGEGGGDLELRRRLRDDDRLRTVPLTEPVSESAAVIVWFPAVLKTKLKVCEPASAAVKV